VSAVAVTADGSRAVMASSDRTLRLWDLESGQSLHALQGHTHWVGAVAVTADGRRAVSGSGDRTLRLWDLQSGAEIAAFTGEADMRACAVVPDGRIITAGDASGRVYFLRLVQPDERKICIEETKIPLLHRKEQASS
jgi:WD40 repeat protein